MPLQPTMAATKNIQETMEQIQQGGRGNFQDWNPGLISTGKEDKALSLAAKVVGMPPTWGDDEGTCSTLFPALVVH